MRVAWVHPTWRDLVIERLADDDELRRRFLARCGPHGIALALSTRGGERGGRALPLIACDEEWDAVGDRIYALAPELEARDAAVVLTAVNTILGAMLDDALLAGEAAALARLALERFGEVWAETHTIVELSCIAAWLSAAGRLTPPPWPTFLCATWADLRPTTRPDPGDLPEVQRFTDWMTLVELADAFSPDLLGELGHDDPQRALVRAFRDRGRAEAFRQQRTCGGLLPDWELEASRAQRMSDNAIRRVLADL